MKIKYVFHIISATIGGVIGSFIYPFIKHWHPLLFWGVLLCSFVLAIGLGVIVDKGKKSFSERKERKMREKELVTLLQFLLMREKELVTLLQFFLQQKRHQQGENENA